MLMRGLRGGPFCVALVIALTPESETMPDTPSRSTGPAARLEELVHSFRKFTRQDPRIDIGPRGSVTTSGMLLDPDRGVDVRLRCPDTGSAAVLRLSRRGAVLRAVSAVRPLSAGVSTLEDELSVHLDDGFRWGADSFETGADLADALRGHLERRLAAVTEVCGSLADLMPAAAGTGMADAVRWPASDLSRFGAAGAAIDRRPMLRMRVPS
jgi:hypothetical protein